MPSATTTATTPRYGRLTAKQEAFCVHYFEHRNASAAALAAGYAPRTVRQMGHETLSKPYIQTRLAALQQRAEDASIAGVVERKQVLTEIVRGRFADFMVDVANNPEKLKSAALQEIRTVSTTKARITTIKLHDPVRAIGELNKMDGIYQPDGAINVDARTQVNNITVTSPEAESLTQRIIDGDQTG
jgi:phage terminase small subunit